MPSKSQSRRSDPLARARRHLDAGRWDEATHDLGRVLARDPDDLRVRLQLAETLAAMEDRTEAVRVLDDGLRRSPAEHELWYLRVTVLLEGGALDEALRALDEASRAVGNDADLLAFRAGILIDPIIGRARQARDELAAALAGPFKTDDRLAAAYLRALTACAQDDEALVVATAMLARGTSDLGALLLVAKAALARRAGREVLLMLEDLGPEERQHPMIAIVACAAHRQVGELAAAECERERALAAVGLLFPSVARVDELLVDFGG